MVLLGSNGSPKFTGNRSFTLIELLVSIVIIMILVAMLLPALVVTRERGRRAACMNNSTQMTLGVTMYADENDGFLPPYYRTTNNNMFLGSIMVEYYPAFLDAIGGDAAVTACPSNPDLPEPKLITGGNQRYDASILYLGGWVTGQFDSFFQAPGGDSWVGGDLPYWSPEKVSEDPERPLFADRIRRVPKAPYTEGNHGSTGYIKEYVDLLPGTIGIKGGNVTLSDGSVSFKKVQEMTCDPLEYDGYLDWFTTNSGLPAPLPQLGQGWNRAHNAKFGQWFF